MAARYTTYGTCLLATLLLAAPPAQGWGDAAEGREIAQRWCSECHLVAEDQPVATPDVPTFMEIARGADDDFGLIEGFLADPHPPMAGLSLSREEIRNLIAYFATFR